VGDEVADLVGGRGGVRKGEMVSATNEAGVGGAGVMGAERWVAV
jgi:hypothetical protein